MLRWQDLGDLIPDGTTGVVGDLAAREAPRVGLHAFHPGRGDRFSPQQQSSQRAQRSA